MAEQAGPAVVVGAAALHQGERGFEQLCLKAGPRLAPDRQRLERGAGHEQLVSAAGARAVAVRGGQAVDAGGLRLEVGARGLGHAVVGSQRAGAIAGLQAAAGQAEGGGGERGVGARHDVVPAGRLAGSSADSHGHPSASFGASSPGSERYTDSKLVRASVACSRARLARPRYQPTRHSQGSAVSISASVVLHRRPVAQLDQRRGVTQLDLDGALGRCGQLRDRLLRIARR